MPKGLQHKGIVRRNKMLQAAIKLFLQNGYEKTTTAAIAREAGMAPSSFFAAFESKEELLLTLVKMMFSNQFESASQLAGAPNDPVMMYAMETSLQMYVTEMSDSLRDLYVMAYSLPTTSEYVYSSMAARLQQIFTPYMPGAEAKDFYEMDIASAGITRAFMAKPCDLYFTMENKLRRYLQCLLTLYNIPKAQQQTIIAAVLQMDLQTVAEQLIQTTVQKAMAGIEM